MAIIALIFVFHRRKRQFGIKKRPKKIGNLAIIL